MIPKEKTRITITIPKTMEEYLRKRSKKFKINLSKIITAAIDQHYYEYEDDYPWEKIRKETKNDKSKK